MTWKKSVVKVLGGLLMLGSLALTSGADWWDGTSAMVFRSFHGLG